MSLFEVLLAIPFMFAWAPLIRDTFKQVARQIGKITLEMRYKDAR